MQHKTTADQIIKAVKHVMLVFISDRETSQRLMERWMQLFLVADAKTEVHLSAGQRPQTYSPKAEYLMLSENK